MTPKLKMGLRLKWIGKPDSVMTLKKSHSDHSSCPRIAPGIERPYPRARVDHPTLLFGLAPGGVCQAFIITDEPVSSYLAFSTLPSAGTKGGVFSVVLSPDHSGPPLAATLSYGVRTFLPSFKKGDRLIHFSPREVF